MHTISKEDIKRGATAFVDALLKKFKLKRWHFLKLGALSTPEEKCIDFPEQKYISEADKEGPVTRSLFRDQACVRLSAGVSALARRERCLL